MVHYIDGVMVIPEKADRPEAELKKLGVVLGFTPFAYLEKIKTKQIRKYEMPSMKGLIRKVQKEIIDGAYMNVSVGRYTMQKLYGNTEILRFNSNLPHTKSTRHLSTLRFPQIIKEFDSFLIENKDKIEKLKIQHKVEEGLE